MRITPLIHHAAARVPQVTSKFSDVYSASIAAVADDVTTITCEAPHAVDIGNRIAVCISNAVIQTQILSVTLGDDEDAIVTFSGPHGLVNNPTNPRNVPFNASLTFTGFDDPLMNVAHEFIEIIDSTSCRIVEPEGADLTVSASSGMFNPLDLDLAGWHPVSAISETELQMPTPDRIRTDVIANDVTVATNIKIWGALSFQHIEALYSQETSETINDLRMFIVPQTITTMSKDRNAKSSAIAEISPSITFRQMLLDGFHVIVVVPTTDSRSGLLETDLCQGEILALVLRVFQGHIPKQPDLPNATPFAAILKQHGPLSHQRAYYVHEYEFEVPIQLTNQDNLQPFEETADVQIETISEEETGSAQPIGTSATADLVFDGIYNSEMKQPLTARVNYEDQT